MRHTLEKLSADYGIHTVYVEQTTSTNDLARNREQTHGDVIIAESQTKGRGQRGNDWQSDGGENLTFSVLLEPQFMPASKQFLLSEVVALSLVDMLAGYGIEAKVKWTNDIYINEQKVAGILIENDIMGTTLWRTIVGVGLNVNQREFDPSLPNPTSMVLFSGREFNRGEVLRSYYEALMRRYDALREGGAEQIEREYHNKLYLLNTPHLFYLPSAESFTGIIRRVEPSGVLIIEHANGNMQGYQFGDIEFSQKGDDISSGL